MRNEVRKSHLRAKEGERKNRRVGCLSAQGAKSAPPRCLAPRKAYISGGANNQGYWLPVHYTYALITGGGEGGGGKLARAAEARALEVVLNRNRLQPSQTSGATWRRWGQTRTTLALKFDKEKSSTKTRLDAAARDRWHGLPMTVRRAADALEYLHIHPTTPNDLQKSF